MAEAPRPPRPGDPLTAAFLTQLVAFVAGNQLSSDPSSGLESSSGPDGTSFSVRRPAEFWLKITFVGPSGSYSWVRQTPATGGGWTDGPERGYTSADPARGARPPDPAWEANANAGLAVGYRVDASRDEAVGRVTIRARAC